MAVLRINKFSGVAPRISPNRLPPEMAQTAVNTRFVAGTLAPWKEPVTVLTGLSAAENSTIYRFGRNVVSDSQHWFHWPADVDVVKGAIASDTSERTYFTHPTLGARLTYNGIALTGGSGDYPWASLPLGVPAPLTGPTATVTTNGASTQDDESRVWAMTYLTSLGEESQPSPLSNVLTFLPSGSSVTLTDLGTTAPAGYAGYITAKRIYRSNSGDLATSLQLVDEIPISQSSYVDDVPSELLSETIPSTNWTPPPPGCFGITQMANGIMLLFKGYDIYPSEAYRPFAYPVDYSLSVDAPIVGSEAIGSSAVICTTGHPYLLTGTDPSALSLVKLEAPQGCVSKRSICAVDGGVLYASPDGMIFVSTSGQTNNITEGLFSRDEWQAINPSSISGYFHDGRYFGFYSFGATKRGFILDPKQEMGAFTFIDTYATAGFSDLIQDALYLKVGTQIVKWGAGTANKTYVWRSGIAELPNPTNPACAQVLAKSYPVTFKMYADGALKHTQTVTSDEAFWLPSGYRARYLEIEISGSSEVLSAAIASSPEELRAA